MTHPQLVVDNGQKLFVAVFVAQIPAFASIHGSKQLLVASIFEIESDYLLPPLALVEHTTTAEVFAFRPAVQVYHLPDHSSASDHFSGCPGIAAGETIATVHRVVGVATAILYHNGAISWTSCLDRESEYAQKKGNRNPYHQLLNVPHSLFSSPVSLFQSWVHYRVFS